MWEGRRHSTVSLLQQRELGSSSRQPTHGLAFERMGEDRAAHYELEETACKLPPSVRSTFLMVFSPDCTKVASTHGDHRIHVCEVSTGRLAHTLEGHPRTPWCLAFHPSSNHILASGCLAGQVRVWDLRGGSEVWSSREGTVISSLAFHPLEPLLAIATANRVVLWHWRKGHAVATCKTASQREKVRFVQFCSPRGDSLVTGITNNSVEPGSPRVLDPLLGPQVGALRVPAADVGGSSQRRSILTRLMSMYQHLEGLEEGGSRWTEDSSSADDEAGLSAGPSSSPGAASPHSRHFWATFYRLRSICSRLERRMQHHQLRSSLRQHVGTSSRPSSSRDSSSQAGRSSSSSRGTAAGPSGSPPPLPSAVQPDVSLSLVSLLSRLQTSLQSLSSAALTTAVAREQIHQVRLRITEILERLSNVSGYRARLTSLRDQIYEAAAVSAGGPWPNPPLWETEEAAPHGGGGDSSPVIQHWDLAYCLWLVEMSLQLTRQMQRILAADYRLTQLHLSASSSRSTGTMSSSRTALASSPPRRRGGLARSPPPPPQHSQASTSRGAASSSRPPWLSECPRVRPPLGRRQRPSNEQSSSSDSLDSSDEESLNFSRVPLSSRVRNLSAVGGGGPLAAGRFWPASPPAMADDDLPIPEVRVSSSSSPPPVRPTAPVPPPASGRGPPPDAHLWNAPPAYLSVLYEGSFRPRLSVYETGPNLTHRIQCWDMTGSQLPDIGDAQACLVAPRCKIHNDSSVALGGGLLAALVPCGLLGASLCVYSLRPPHPQLLHTWSFGANAISVSLSPMARYLVVGFATTRAPGGYFAPHDREVVAQIFKLSPPDSDGPSSSSQGPSSSSSCRGQLQQVGNLSQPGHVGGPSGQPPVSLNSVRWLPRPGEGLIYGTNRGSLCICRPLKPISKGGEEEGGSSARTSHSGPTRDSTSPFVMLTDQVDRAARDTTIRVLSTASQTAIPQTQTTGTQTTLRGSGILVQQPQPGGSSSSSGDVPTTSAAVPYSFETLSSDSFAPITESPRSATGDSWYIS